MASLFFYFLIHYFPIPLACTSILHLENPLLQKQQGILNHYSSIMHFSKHVC